MELLRSQAVLYVETKDWKGAVRTYSQMINLKPSANLLAGRGYLYIKTNRLDLARKDLDRALKLSPKLELAMANKALLLTAKGDYCGALPYLRKLPVPKEQPSNHFNRRGYAALQCGQVDEAISDFGKAIRSDPKLKIALANRGDAYDRKGAYEKAVADYTAALALDPKSVPLHRARGWALAKLGKGVEAEADYLSALAVDPVMPP